MISKTHFLKIQLEMGKLFILKTKKKKKKNLLKSLLRNMRLEKYIRASLTPFIKKLYLKKHQK